MPTEDRPGAVTYAVIGTLLAEPVILALRRMAHEHLSTSAAAGASAGGVAEDGASTSGH